MMYVIAKRDSFGFAFKGIDNLARHGELLKLM
jgi:hypothetical protein